MDCSRGGFGRTALRVWPHRRPRVGGRVTGWLTFHRDIFRAVASKLPMGKRLLEAPEPHFYAPPTFVDFHYLSIAECLLVEIVHPQLRKIAAAMIGSSSIKSCDIASVICVRRNIKTSCFACRVQSAANRFAGSSL